MEVECQNTKVRGDADWCALCSNTGKVHHDTDAEVWLLVAACVAVGRACAQAVFVQGAGESPPTGERSALDALDAAEAWLAEPTQERGTDRVSDAGLDWLDPVLWAISGSQTNGHSQRRLCHALQAAAKLLGETRVREPVAAEIVRRVLGTKQAKGTKE